MKTLKRFAVPVVALALAVVPAFAAVHAQEQAEEMPEMIDGKKVHEVRAEVVNWERPALTVDIVQPEESGEEMTEERVVYMMEQPKVVDDAGLYAPEFPDHLPPGSFVTVWYTEGDEGPQVHQVQIHEMGTEALSSF